MNSLLRFSTVFIVVLITIINFDFAVLLTDYSQCGKSEVARFLIVGGRPAQPGAWPWMAALGYSKSGKEDLQFLCGGTLISDRHILTAAICLRDTGKSELSKVRLGATELNDTVESVHGISLVDAPIAKIDIHPDFQSRPVKNNIGIITLKDPVKFTKYIRPICLPNSVKLQSESFEKKSFTITGWGTTNFRGSASSKLIEAEVPAVETKICKQAYAAQSQNTEIDEKVICAGNGIADTCQGDSGGPMALPIDGSYYVIGISSFGVRCAEPNYPAVYTRVSQYVDWIKKIIH